MSGYMHYSKENLIKKMAAVRLECALKQLYRKRCSHFLKELSTQKVVQVVNAIEPERSKVVSQIKATNYAKQAGYIMAQRLIKVVKLSKIEGFEMLKRHNGIQNATVRLV